jgi:hypothetical protein
VRGFESFSDELKHAFGVAKYVHVPESQDTITAGVQEFSAAPIIRILSVLSAVGLNH